MERFREASATFEHAIDRARQMVSLYDALSALRPREPANDDALRSAYILAVSSFDFFAHELAATEARHRLVNNLMTRNIHLPMDVMTVVDSEIRVATAVQHVRRNNSFKAFVDHAKLAEMLSCYCSRPWENIVARVNGGDAEAERRPADEVKGQLKSIWKRRNQIAHEADVNPTLAGVALWPIDKLDTNITINFISQIGSHLPAVIAEPLTEETPEDSS